MPTICFKCGATIPDGHDVSGTGATQFCADCAPQAGPTRRTNIRVSIRMGPNYALAIVLGVLAAAVGAWVWYEITIRSNFYVSFVSMGVGLLVGYAVHWGAGRYQGKSLQVISVGLTLAAMLISQYLIGRNGYPELGKDFFAVVSDSLRHDPLILIFWAFAVYVAYRVTASSKTGHYQR